MATTFKTPGVFIEEVSALPPSIEQVPTAIPAFIGYTQKAVGLRGRKLQGVPFRISSMLDYERCFGLPAGEAGSIVVEVPPASPAADPVGKVIAGKQSRYRMHYALQHYFGNQGGPCYIVSAGGYESGQGKVDKAALLAGLQATRKVSEITLYVFPDAQGLKTAKAFYDLHIAALDLCAALQDRFTIMDVWPDPTTDRWEDHIALLRDSLPDDEARLKYGAAYFPNLHTGIAFHLGDEAQRDKKVKVQLGGATLSLAQLKKRDPALYLRAVAALGKTTVTLPPSPAIAGIYAGMDASRGVWKAPANVAVANVIATQYRLTDNEQEGLNVDAVRGKSVNIIREFPARGILVWGARTLAGNSNEWRYVPVRRFFLMVEESIENGIAQFVFEPNDANTWVRIRAMVENFLIKQWQAGALSGTKPEQAFYVRVGLNATMTAQDILEGRLILEVGLAMLRPAEFTVLRISQKMVAA